MEKKKKTKKIRPKNNKSKQRWKKASSKNKILDSAKQVLKKKEEKKQKFDYPEIPHNTYYPCWRIFDFKNWAFFKHRERQHGHHSAIVVAKQGDNYALIQTSHYGENDNNYKKIEKLKSDDTKDSYIKKDLCVRVRNNTGSSINDAMRVSDERTDLRQIGLEEQKEILKVLNNKPSNRKRYYEEFVNYNNKKSDK